MRKVHAVVACAAVVCLSSAGPAAQASVPSRSVSLNGFSITWPKAGAVSVSAGTDIVVSVRPTRSAPAHSRAEFVFARVNSRGTVLTVLSRRALRSGKFTATLPTSAASAGTFRLSVAAGGTKRAVAVQAQAAPSTSPQPSGACPYSPAAPASATIQIQPSSTTAGQPLNVSIENTGSNCLNYGDDFIDWQRADATGWTSIPQHGAISDVLHYLQPGETKQIEALSPPQTLTAGHYRLITTFRQGTPPNGPVVVASKEFDITS